MSGTSIHGSSRLRLSPTTEILDQTASAETMATLSGYARSDHPSIFTTTLNSEISWLSKRDRTCFNRSGTENCTRCAVALDRHSIVTTVPITDPVRQRPARSAPSTSDSAASTASTDTARRIPKRMSGRSLNREIRSRILCGERLRRSAIEFYDLTITNTESHRRPD